MLIIFLRQASFERILYSKNFTFLLFVWGGRRPNDMKIKKNCIRLIVGKFTFIFIARSPTLLIFFVRSVLCSHSPFSHFISFYMSVKNDEHITHKQQQKKNASRKASTASARESSWLLSWAEWGGFAKNFKDDNNVAQLSHTKKKEEKKKQHKPEQQFENSWKIWHAQKALCHII